MIKFIFDPKIFNYIIMTLYCLSAIRWAFARRWADMLYWIFALGITSVVTFLYKR